MEAARAWLLAAPLVVVFCASLIVAGRLLARAFRIQVGGDGAAHLVIGIAAYVVAGLLLGLAGVFLWPLLAALALAPGVVGLARSLPRIRGAGERCRVAIAACRREAAVIAVLAGVLALYLVVSLAPLIHYDLLVNYLAVPKDYLLQGNLAVLPHNVHSSLSLPLHVLLAYPLAIGELADSSPFLFGHAPAYGVLCLLALVGCVAMTLRIAAVLSTDRSDGLSVGLLAGLLWLCMPMTLLLATLKYTEFLTTFLALTMVAACLRFDRDRSGDVWVVALLAGLLLSAKLHFGALVAACCLPLLLRTRVAQWIVLAAPATLLVGISQFRNLLAYGDLRFPFHGGHGPAAEAAASLLAENSIELGPALWNLPASLGRVVTLQPETGVSLVVVLALLRGRVRDPRMWLIGVAPLLAVAAVAGQAQTVLRWTQPSVVVLLVMAAANLVVGVDRRSAARWALLGLIAAGLALGLRWVDSLLGVFDHLRTDTTAYVSRQIPSYPVRATLASYPGRVLYVGELHGYLGARNGVIPGPQDGHVLARYFAGGEPGAIAERLRRDDIRWLSVFHGFDQRLARAGYWRWLGSEDADLLDRALSTFEVVDRRNGVTVYVVPE